MVGDDRPLRLVRLDLDDVPVDEPPPGLELRAFAAGDDERWLALQEAAEPAPPFADTERAEFARIGAQRSARCLFLVTDDGIEVGTITAWRARRDVDGSSESEGSAEESFRAAIERQRLAGSWGMPAWLAVHPDHRGRSLSLSLVSAAMQVLRADHDRALVRTTTSRPAAIKRWLQFGFGPDLIEPGAGAVWAAVWEAYPALQAVAPAPVAQ